MKKSPLFLLVCLFFAGCSYQIAPKANTYFVDVREYTNQSFYITPSTSVNHRYYPLGQITVEVTPGYSVDMWSGAKTKSETISLNTSMKKLVDDAKKMGADCIIDFRVESHGDYYYLKGFAIKSAETPQ